MIQMKDVKVFRPNWNTHREFGKALREAEEAGVKILAYDCLVGESFMEIKDPVAVDLEVPDGE